MATFYWTGSIGHSGGWGHPGGATTERNMDAYLSGVTTGMCWNVAGNWLEQKRGLTGDCGGYEPPEHTYFIPASRVPGSGDDVHVQYFNAGPHECLFDENGLGVGVTGEYPKAPLLFGGYHNTNLAEGANLSFWTDGGGWIGAGSGNTGGRLSKMTVYANYLHYSTPYYFAGGGTHIDKRFPVGIPAGKVTSIESKTGLGNTFSGLQIYAEKFEVENSADEICSSPSCITTFPEFQYSNEDNEINLILSDITNAEVGHHATFVARGCTFDQINLSRGHNPTALWYTGDPDNHRDAGWQRNTCRCIIDSIYQTTRGNAGNAAWAGFPSTIKTYCNVGGEKSGHVLIKTTATIPTLDVTSKNRIKPIRIDADITTCNIHPQGLQLEKAFLSPRLDARNPNGRNSLQGYDLRNEPDPRFKPVIFTSTENAREGVHTIGTLNMKDRNEAHNIEMFTGNAEDPTVGKGQQNLVGFNCGITCDTLNLFGGKLFVGATHGKYGTNKESIATGIRGFLTDNRHDPISGCAHGGAGIEDMHGVLIKDAVLYYHAMIDERHPTDSTWKRWKVGSGTAHPSAVEGYRIKNPNATVVKGCDSYSVADFAYQGPTSASRKEISYNG